MIEESSETVADDPKGILGGLLRVRHAPALMVLGFIARIPLGMTGLALLLVLQAQRGSLVQAALVGGANALGSGLTGHPQRRLVDRFGISRTVLINGVVSAASLLAILAGAPTAPLVVLIAAAALAGYARPQITSCERAIWAALELDSATRAATAAWEKFALLAVAIVGPLVVSAASVAAGPSAALGVAVVIGIVGQVGFALLPPARRWASRRRARPRARVISNSPLIRVELVVIAFSATAGGVLLVGLLVLGLTQGSASSVGLLLAGIGCGAFLGNALYGVLRGKAELDTQLTRWLLLDALGLTLLSFADSIWAAAALAIVAGAAGAPVMACAYALAADLAPDRAFTESFGLVARCEDLGLFAGIVLGGIVAGREGGRGALLVAAAVAAIGGLVALMLLRRTRGHHQDNSPIGMPSA